LVRYEEHLGGSASALSFDGETATKQNGPLDKADLDLIETLAYDTPEHFLTAASGMVGVRKLGSRFRMDGPPGVAYTGPLYDVYVIIDQVKRPGGLKQQSKVFHVNSHSYLVERIRYKDVLAPRSAIEVLLEGWTTMAGNRVAQKLRRFENGLEVLRLEVASARFEPPRGEIAFKLNGTIEGDRR
jgi:hypothetical protein